MGASLAVTTPERLGPSAPPPPPALLAALCRSQQQGAIGAGALVGHLAHATGFLTVAQDVGGLGVSFRFLDLGSGGGLPGLVIASLASESGGTLLDGRVERARLLAQHVGALGLEHRLQICGQRAELAGRRPDQRLAYDLVVARAFGPPAVTAECAAPFLRPGGLLVVSEPPAPDPARWPATPLMAFGLQPLGGPRAVEGPGGAGHYQVLRQVAPCDERWPRRVGAPSKRPHY